MILLKLKAAPSSSRMIEIPHTKYYRYAVHMMCKITSSYLLRIYKISVLRVFDVIISFRKYSDLLRPVMGGRESEKKNSSGEKAEWREK